MSGPIVRQYKGGSIVYFEKDKSEDVYVLQTGRVVLTFTNVNGSEVKEDVRLGEFFGVKSALGKYPREETAQVIGSATVLVFKIPDFEKFVSVKTHLILKMLKVFSSQLRQVHRQVREILGQGDAKNPSFELMNVAEAFHKSGQFENALYSYEVYLKYYPEGSYVERASTLLAHAKKNTPFPVSMPDLEYTIERKQQPNAFAKVSDLMEDKAVPTKSPASEADSNSIQSLFSKGTTLYSAGKYSDSLNIFRSLVTRTDSKNETEEQLLVDALFHLGNCFWKLKSYDNAISSYSAYVKKNPKGSLVKEAIFQMGVVGEDKGETEMASALFNKVLLMTPDDRLTEEARVRLQGLV